MKKYFMLLAAAATVLAVSCNKEKEQPKVDPTPGTEIEDNTPQPIRFGTNIAEVKSPITKAAIENTGWGANQQLYVYAFRQTNGVPTITDAGAYIKGTLVNAPETFINGGVREPITVDRDNNHNPYYYENGVVYSFFGYYIGGANQTTPAYADDNDVKTLSTSVTIRGVDDVMLADTDKFDDYIAANSPTVSLEKIYSEVSARQGVVPDLKFKHQLARFKFETMYGGNGNADDINIVNIQMKSVKVGTLTIASDNGNQGFVATGTWPAHDGQPGADGKYGFTDDNSFTLKTDANNVATGNPGNGVFAPLGESIMTFPQGLQGEAPTQTSPVYHLLLTLTQKGRYQANSTTELEEFYVPMDIDFSKVVDAQQHAIPNKYAEAGKMYVIRLVIYGSEQIDMTVSLEDWEYGGETQVDPDQDTRPVPTITVKDKNDQNEITSLPDLAIAEEYDHIIATATYGTTPANIASTEILFASSDKKVATVTTGGKVTGVSAGTCKIYVYVNGTDEYQGALKTVAVNVTGGIAVPDPASTLSGLAATYTIDNSTPGATWDIPGSNTLKVQVGGADATPQPATFSYASGNEAIATVSNAGVVTAVADGIVNITISWAAEAGKYAAGSFVVAVTVENTPAPLPTPEFTGLLAADINILQSAITAGDVNTPAVYDKCQYGDAVKTDCDTAITISVTKSGTPVDSGFSLNADKTITVAQNTTAGTYVVKLHVAAKDGVYQAGESASFNIVIAE